jgi:hypothetical protein
LSFNQVVSGSAQPQLPNVSMEFSPPAQLNQSNPSANLALQSKAVTRAPPQSAPQLIQVKPEPGLKQTPVARPQGAPAMPQGVPRPNYVPPANPLQKPNGQTVQVKLEAPSQPQGSQLQRRTSPPHHYAPYPAPNQNTAPTYQPQPKQFAKPAALPERCNQVARAPYDESENYCDQEIDMAAFEQLEMQIQQ